MEKIVNNKWSQNKPQINTKSTWHTMTGGNLTKDNNQNDDIFKNKYLKYKNKYLKQKK